jgi:hypothetical protein
MTGSIREHEDGIEREEENPMIHHGTIELICQSYGEQDWQTNCFFFEPLGISGFGRDIGRECIEEEII